MILKVVYFAISVVFLVYLILPGPAKVEDFSPLPNSLKSDEPGDTVQVPNINAYYSDFYRNFVTSFYKNNFQEQTPFFFPPLRLNYPPEFAYTAIKDQTRSTYLEEYTYPFRDSVFVNGFEPFYENGQPKYSGATDIIINGTWFKSKATLRYYPSPLWARIIVWFGINASLICLWKMGKDVLKHG